MKESHQVDLRTITLGVPPQEVRKAVQRRMEIFKTYQGPPQCEKFRPHSKSVPKVLTKDSVTVSVDAVVYYRWISCHHYLQHSSYHRHHHYCSHQNHDHDDIHHQKTMIITLEICSHHHHN